MRGRRVDLGGEREVCREEGEPSPPPPPPTPRGEPEAAGEEEEEEEEEEEPPPLSLRGATLLLPLPLRTMKRVQQSSLEGGSSVPPSPCPSTFARALSRTTRTRMPAVRPSMRSVPTAAPTATARDTAVVEEEGVAGAASARFKLPGGASRSKYIAAAPLRMRRAVLGEEK